MCVYFATTKNNNKKGRVEKDMKPKQTKTPLVQFITIGPSILFSPPNTINCLFLDLSVLPQVLEFWLPSSHVYQDLLPQSRLTP